MNNNNNNNNLKTFQKFFQQQTLNQLKGKKVYAVMLFYTEGELHISNNYNKWINYANKYFTNGVEALNYYSNTPCPSSQLIDANTHEELLQQMNQMIDNFNNQIWLQENIYPYL